jgi:large exoprotein involved in heme utilization and adhesion
VRTLVLRIRVKALTKIKNHIYFVTVTLKLDTSSQSNFDGTVQINNIGVDPNSGLVELPENIIDPSQQIASGSSANQGS